MALTAYELEREARIARNNERLRELAVKQCFEEFHTCVRANAKAKRAKQPRQPRQYAPMDPAEQRRSGRLANQPAVEYNESNLDKIDNVRTFRQHCAAADEIYTQEHADALGDYKEEWELFQDGYDADGNRIYDKANGQTCHQCRQKTLGLRTSCSACNSLKGVFCGDCLFMRYGENVKEAAANPNWTCPDCRGICNCSIHRVRKGWAPTGSLYRRAIADGYKSVAHMLILSNLGKASSPPSTSPTEVPEKPAEPVDIAIKVSEAPAAPVPTSQEPDVQQDTDKAVKGKKQQKMSDILPQKRKMMIKKKSNLGPKAPLLKPAGLGRMTRSRSIAAC